MISKLIIIALCISCFLGIMDTYYIAQAVHDHIHVIHSIDENDHKHESTFSDCRSTEECTDELNGELDKKLDEELFDKRE